MSDAINCEYGGLAFRWPTSGTWWFLALGMVSLVAFWSRLYVLAALALRDERYTYIVLVPVISTGLIWVNRHKILLESRYCPSVGIPVLLAGIGLSIATGRKISAGEDANLCIAVFAIILVWTALFVFCYGVHALRRSAFPLLFLLFMIPIPTSLMNTTVIALQKGSAEMTAGVFRLMRMPFLREEFTFALPGGISIKVAEQCSGIRSSLSLFLSGILAANLFLGSSWRRICFALLIVPVVIFKNAVRIATISWLGVYVDRSYFFGNLHRHSGVPFSAIAIAILGLALLLLRKSEGRHKARVA